MRYIVTYVAYKSKLYKKRAQKENSKVSIATHERQHKNKSTQQSIFDKAQIPKNNKR